jgi:hypothetical protein
MRYMKSKTGTITIRVKPALLDRINAFAKSIGEDNTSAAARMLITAGLEEYSAYPGDDFEPLPFAEPPLPER